MVSQGGNPVSKPKQLPADEVPDVDVDESDPPAISDVDSAPAIDVRAFCYRII